MSEFSQNGNISTNFSNDTSMRFQENSLCGSRIYHAWWARGRAGGRAADMTRLLATALRNCDVDFGQKYGVLVFINGVTSVKITINWNLKQRWHCRCIAACLFNINVKLGGITWEFMHGLKNSVRRLDFTINKREFVGPWILETPLPNLWTF
jgi:hypothetical protein